MAHHATATEQETADTAPSIHDEVIGHGNSPAAWTCVLIMTVGCIIAAVGFIMASNLVFWGFGIGIVVIGLIVGWIMKKAGYGVDGSKLQSSGH
ncbi:HGxxPAAW family protein [Arthrobacter sp. USHLN218]|uniref:HGxxPAAW family protein n=1 Tax=Arthrobacter sp. USHLN218 TaxID=3081232 RepID=UPI003019846C